MPKYYCNNEICTEHKKLVDIDTSFLAYYSNLEHNNFIIKNKKFHCKYCLTELEFNTPEESKTPMIGKWGTASKEEKMNMLRKRSRDLSIPENRIIKQRKDHMDRTGSTKYIN